MKPLSVIMLTQNFYPVIGGAERQAMELSKILLKRNVKVKILTRQLPLLKKEEVIENIPIKRLYAIGSGPLNSLSFLLSSFCYLLRHIRTYQVIHVHLASSHAIAASFIGRLCGKRVIVKIGGGNQIGEIVLSRKTIFGRIKLMLLKLLKPTLVMVGQAQEQEIKKEGMQNLNLNFIPNGVNTSTFEPLSSNQREKLRQELKWTGTVFLFLGRFASDKLRLDIFENLINAWQNLSISSGSAKLIFVGQGPLEVQYRQLIQDKNIGDTVRILPATNNVKRMYQAADVFLLPSLTEGLSNAMLEAMSSSLPICGSRVPGIVEIIRDKVHGLLFDPFKIEEIEASFKDFLDNKDSRIKMGQEARSRVQDYSIERMVDRYMTLYQAV